MNFELPENARRLQAEVIDFARNELNSDDLIERDRESRFSLDGWKKCADFGLTGLPIPNEFGGRGLGLTETIAAMEAMGYGCADKGLIFMVNAHLFTGVLPVFKFGSDKQKEELFPDLCNGNLICGNAASEPETGSDVYSMKTEASRSSGEYVLSGRKMFVCGGKHSNFFVVYARTDSAAGPLGLSAFLVPKGPQVKVIREIEKMGLRTAGMGEILFDNVRLAESQRLGPEGAGASVFGSSMEWERGCLLAMHVGNLKRQIEMCVARAKKRFQYNRPVGSFQAVSHRIADMHVRYEAARLLVYKIGWLKDQGKSAHLESATAKVFVSDTAVQTSLSAIQTFGGYGFLTETEVERDLRDAIGSKLYSGTTDIQRNIIARRIGLPPN